MDILGNLPDWGQVSLFSLSLAVNAFFVAAYMRGELVSRKHFEAVQKMADTWQHGWEVSQENETSLRESVSRLSDLTEVFSHFIDSLPKLRGR